MSLVEVLAGVAAHFEPEDHRVGEAVDVGGRGDEDVVEEGEEEGFGVVIGFAIDGLQSRALARNGAKVNSMGVPACRATWRPNEPSSGPATASAIAMRSDRNWISLLRLC